MRDFCALNLTYHIESAPQDLPNTLTINPPADIISRHHRINSPDLNSLRVKSGLLCVKGRDIGKQPYQIYGWSPCEICGKERWVQMVADKAVKRVCRSCTSKRINLGASNGNWNGGKVKTVWGYIGIRCKSHPRCDVNGYVPEHRFVMEKALGRLLTPEEVVHHIDGNKENNNLDNLMLFPSKSEHQKYHRKERKGEHNSTS